MRIQIIIFISIVISSFSYGQSDSTFTLTSKDLGGSFTIKQVNNSFGCNGDNISPHLKWTNAPEDTKSFAITMYDKDAPTGSGWWHWVVFDIPTTVTELKTGASTSDSTIIQNNIIQSINDFGTFQYGGPCPPQGSGFHTYVITLYALDIERLSLPKSTNPATVGFYLNSHIITKASLIVYYKK